jgi:hypothetical protein
VRVIVATIVLASTLVVSLGPVSAGPGKGNGDAKVRWDNVVGVIQPGNKVGTGAGQVTGAGQPWFTEDGQATIDLHTGRLKFSVRGLVLMGGNGIGTRAGVTQVKGTLVCDVDGSTGNSVLVDTDAVPLSLQGDAAFVGDVPLDPLCVSETDIAFLIRAGNDTWLAAGAVRVGP